MTPNQTHLGYVDGLRGLAALYVTGCHAYLTYAVLYSSHPQDAWSAGLLCSLSWLQYGRSAVAVFIKFFAAETRPFRDREELRPPLVKEKKE